MRLINADKLKKECRSVPDPRGRYAELRIIEDYEIDDAPTIFEIPDNATNGDIIQTMFPNVDFVTDVFGGFNFPSWWWNSQYK